MRKILIFTYYPRHFKKIIPVIKELMKSENIELSLVLMTSEERQIAEDNGFKYRMLDEFTDKKRGADFDLGWGLEPLINAIDQVKPDLFIAIEVNYILRNAVRYCKQNKIPSLIIQHGTPNKFSLHAFAPFEGNCFAAWGDFTKDFLVENGVDPNKIVVTGGAVFDHTLSIKPDRKKIAELVGLDVQKKWITFTTQGTGAGNCPSEQEIVDGITEVLKASMKYEDHQLIFQVHPSQNLDKVKEIVASVSGHDAVVCRYSDTEELMAASHSIITFFSTTALDAVIMKKPLLLINLTDDRDFLPFAKMNAAIAAYEKVDIVGKYVELVSDSYMDKNRAENLKKAANYVNFGGDGLALQRVIELINKMLTV